MKLTALDIEIAIAECYGIRAHLIIPNVSWGLWLGHECDLLLLTNSGYAWEFEIKVSKQDLIRDKFKGHNHFSPKIKYLYFAIPEHLENEIEHIPERAGIIVVTKENEDYYCNVIRRPTKNCDYKFSDSERCELARLGALRIWGLKKKLLIKYPEE